MKDFFNIDDDYLEDEESEEAKQLKEKIELSLISISQSITQAQTNLDAGLYTKFLKNINYMKGMIDLLSDLSKVFDIVLNARIEDLRGLGIDIDELNNKIQTAMNFIQPTEISEKLTINKGKTKTLKATIKPNNTTDTVKYTSSDKNKKQDDDDYLW